LPQNQNEEEETDSQIDNVPEESTPTTIPSFDGLTEAEVASAAEAAIEEIIANKEVEELTGEDKAQIAAVVTAVIEAGITESAATELASNPAVLASVTTDQAEQIFETINADALDESAAEEIVNAVQEASEEIRATFEEAVDLFQGAFDSYKMLGQTINVGQRRTVVAVNLVTAATAATAMAATTTGGSQSSSNTQSSSNDNKSARREDEEEPAGEIAGDEIDWVKRLSIIKKFGYGVMNLGWTLAGSLVVYLTLSGTLQTIAGLASVAAFGAAMYLHMKEPQE
jgi:hypothetical protein